MTQNHYDMVLEWINMIRNQKGLISLSDIPKYTRKTSYSYCQSCPVAMGIEGYVTLDSYATEKEDFPRPLKLLPEFVTKFILEFDTSGNRNLDPKELIRC